MRTTKSERLSGRRNYESYPRLAATALILLGTAAGCATTRDMGRTVVDHHVGMVHRAKQVLTGEARERERRLATMRARSAARTGRHARRRCVGARQSG